MARLTMIQPEQAQGRTRELLDATADAFGMVPNATKVMAHSPAVLDSFLALCTAMAEPRIGAKLHTQIKLATSEANECSYCTSILCVIGTNAGLTATDLLEGRAMRAHEARTRAALMFAKTVLQTHGRVTDADLQAVRDVGFGDADIVEIVASVVVGCFTNFINNVAATTLDIPAAAPLQTTAV